MIETTTGWDETVAALKTRAQEMHTAREAGLAKCRLLTQASARCIRHIHRHQFEEAEKLLQDARRLSREAREALQPHGELFYAGYLHDAEKEMVEASAVFAIVRDQPYPRPDELTTLMMSYLNGMGEAASECRRFALDEMRKGRMEQAEAILIQMETIYDDLITFDFADSMTGGLRRTCDALRAVIERTRSDLTATAAQHELIAELKATRERLGATPE
jgi:translin